MTNFTQKAKIKFIILLIIYNVRLWVFILKQKYFGGFKIMVNLCMHCMESIEDNIEICPNCGKNTSGVRKKMFLPPGSDLAKRYIVGNGINMDNESLE